MRCCGSAVTLVFACGLTLGAAYADAQPTPSGPVAPVATALRARLVIAQRNFVGTAEAMPADKYGYKPTDAHLTFAAHMAHIADVNIALCGLIGGVKSSDVAKASATDSRPAIIAYVTKSFAFCDTALSALTDARLDERVPFNGAEISRAYAILLLSGDWSDHYAVTATYLRLNGMLPPTAKR